MRELNMAIPQEFKSIDPIRSCVYLFFALSLPISIGMMALKLLPEPTLEFSLATLFWLVTSMALGVSAGGAWVLAHEAGHGALIKPRWLENVIGLSIHTVMLVPYFAWRRTHKLHHLHTNNIEGDVAFVPHLPDSSFAGRQRRLHDLLGHTFFDVIFHIILYLFGFLIYLCSSIRGETALLGRFIPICKKTYPTRKLRLFVSLNTVVYFAWVYMMVRLCQADFSKMIFLYIIPIFVVNSWLVLYTMLHHTDESLPWYDHKSWTPSLGALTVCERPFPRWINFLHFQVGRYHMYHHINSSIPHYYAKEVTKAILDRFPQIDPFTSEGILEAAWRMGSHTLTSGKKDGHFYLYVPKDTISNGRT